MTKIFLGGYLNLEVRISEVWQPTIHFSLPRPFICGCMVGDQAFHQSLCLNDMLQQYVDVVSASCCVLVKQ